MSENTGKKICGIIAEYNPFHNGHKYLMDHARNELGADYVIVVMSGDHVQRGEPALMDKYASNLVNGYHFYDINELFVKFIDKMNACLDIDLEEEITKIHEVVNDMNVLLKNMK